ncbi:MAG TPA: hypothetical protein VFC93_10540 [Chloroflexota bacterium]|nr:hypothetical protein [Chloroflexota bacterium]
MSEIVRDLYERFKALNETLRLLLAVSALGICSLYVLGIVSLIAGPRLRQAPVVYAEAIVVTATPTETPTPEPTTTPIPTDTPTATPTVALTIVPAPEVPTVEATPTQRSVQPIAAPTEPKAEPSPPRRAALPTSTPKAHVTPTPHKRR